MLNIPEEVKDLFKRDSVRKNIRIHFPNGEREDITNSNLIAESFSFTESVMSQSEFRFGLCEASMVEFECFGVENIKGYEIEVSHEIDISSLGEEFIAEYGMTSDDVAFPFYRVPYGRFTVDEALRQSDMVRRKITAYGKMLENLKPNEFELTKGNVKFEKNGNYNIDLIKYLYSNVSADSIIPNATYENSTYENPIYIALQYEGYSILANVVYNASVSDSLVRFIPSKLLKSVDEAYQELSEYVQKNIPQLYSQLEFEWESYIRELVLNSSYIGSVKTSDIEKDLYLYTGMPNNETIGIALVSDISLRDKNQNVLVSIPLRNKEEIKMERVDIDAPKITVSYPLKKSGSYYYIKDIPYDQLASYIEEAIELQGKFGKVDRYGNFQMISVNGNFGLYPSEDLYPSETLYPKDPSGGILTQGNYLSAWYDDEYTKPYDRVSVSYKNADEEEMYAEYLIVDIESDTYNASDYQAYSLSENTLIQNGTFTEGQITEILQTVGEALRNIQYMPCDIDAIGMPWVEAGDGLSVLTRDGGFETLVLNRRIDGIQSLKDSITAD